MAAAGVGRRADARDRAAARRGVHLGHVPGVRRARAWSRRPSRCCSWPRSTASRLGTASALEFLGPLGVAVAHGKGGHRLAWPGLAAVGVVLLTQPWDGAVDPIGVLYALGAAVCWAGYILLTQRAGDEVSGINASGGLDARRRPGRHRRGRSRRCCRE